MTGQPVPAYGHRIPFGRRVDMSNEGVWATRTASVSSIAAGVGFGLPCVYGIWYFVDRGEMWTFLGFPTYGGGPFEDVGLETSVPLLGAFLAVCVAEVALGVLLWRRRAVLAGLALLPIEFVFWIGFLLPFGYLLGAVRAVALLMVLWQDRRTRAQRTAAAGAGAATGARRNNSSSANATNQTLHRT
jgi:hypothetical protein